MNALAGRSAIHGDRAFPSPWVGLIALGSIGLLDSFVRFALQGVGTPAPVFPTRRLVATNVRRGGERDSRRGFDFGKRRAARGDLRGVVRASLRGPGDRPGGLSYACTCDP